jgi:glycosyltransferase involved in cell wall biosynthesis
MKIAVITPVFALAGVPLAQVRLARAIAARGHSVDLIVGHVVEGCEFSAPQGLNSIIINKQNVRGMLIPLVSYFKRKQPAIVFSAEDHLTIIVLMAALISGSKAKISGSSRILPTDRLAYSDRPFSKGWILKYSMKLVMHRASILSCVSEDMVKHYKKIFPNGKHLCIYNIIKDAQSLQRSIAPIDHKWFNDNSTPIVVAAGTLTKRKGFGILIEAISLVKKTRRVRLILLGEGYLRSELEASIITLGLAEDVDMPGNVANPLAFFSRSNIIALSSYAEGLPNVLVEGMMCGCTPVATDCPTGPREVLRDGKYGYLVPIGDSKAMAKAICYALDKPIPKAMLNEAVAAFEESCVVDRHFQLLGFRP